jgi:hypothetical protein
MAEDDQPLSGDRGGPPNPHNQVLGGRFWLHTCTKDYPAALPNYLKAGFAVYKEEVKGQG